MTASTQQTEDLTSLHTTLIDSRNGYEEALKDAGPRGLHGLFSEMIAMRQAAAVELEPFLRAGGAEPDESGSFMSTVHRSVISFRSLFNDLDESILPGLIDGERRVLETYDTALASADPALRSVLERHRGDVERRISEMEARRPAA